MRVGCQFTKTLANLLDTSRSVGVTLVVDCPVGFAMRTNCWEKGNKCNCYKVVRDVASWAEAKVSAPISLMAIVHLIISAVNVHVHVTSNNVLLYILHVVPT